MQAEPISDGEFREAASRRMAQAALVCVLVIIATIARTFVSPFTLSKAVLIAGGVLSIAGLFSYLIAITVLIPVRGRSHLTSALILTGLLPWAYAVYLTFYEGIGRFITSLGSIDIWLVARSAFFFLTGVLLAKYTHLLSEYSKLNNAPTN